MSSTEKASTVQLRPTSPSTTTSTTTTTTSTASTTTEADIDVDQITVTRVFGRYMTVDTKQLLKKDELLKKKKMKKVTVDAASVKSEKKHNVPMPPSLVDEQIEVDVAMSSSMHDIDVPKSVSQSPQMTEYDDDSELDAIEMYARDEDLLTTKELIDDMARIMKNGAEIRRNRINHKSIYMKKNHGACFTGADSFFHFNDAETMRQIISYRIDLNLRFKTHSNNGLILWSGRHTAQDDDDFLLLGIENG